MATTYETKETLAEIPVEKRMAHGLEKLKDLKAKAIETLEDVLTGAESEDVKRKAAVDILNFEQKTKNETPVTEEQLGWLGRVILEAEEIRLSVEVCEK